ncbi:MAG: gliding motility-associated C-terminal domain-containing protein [Bacteroidales bacterium]
MIHRFFSSLFLFLSFSFSVVTSNAQPPCEANPVANDYCSFATSICNLNGYCGNTSPFYTNDVSPTNGSNETYTPLGDVFCATIQNNSWLKFIADSNIAIFSVWCFNCANNMGVQMQIYSTTDCYNFIPVSNCWNPLHPANGQITATGLIPGDVYYFMIDGTAGDNCDYVIACDVGVSVSPAISLDQTICPGATTIVSATGALSYHWTSNPPDPSLAGQENNSSITVSPSVTTTYSVVAVTTGQNSFCNNDSTFLSTLVSINNVSGQFTDVTSANCNQNNGSVTVSGTGGNGIYTYLWNTNPAQSTPTISSLAPGTYTVTVSSGGCTSVVTASVANIPPPQATISSFSNALCGQANGSAVVAVTGGIPPFTYAWNTIPPQTGQVLQNVSGGTYIVTVTDIVNCTAVQTVTLIDLPGPVVSLPALVDICHNQLPLTLSGGTPSGGTYSGPGVVNNVFNPLLTGVGVFNITYIYADSNGCLDQDVQPLEVLPSPVVDFPDIPGLCVSASPVLLTGATPSGGTYSGMGVTNAIFDPSVAGAGSFDLIYSFQNIDGCSSSDTSLVEVFNLPVVSQTSLPNVCINTPTILAGGTPLGGTYSGTGITNGVLNPEINGLGNCTITYVYADSNGCIDSTHTNLIVVDVPVVGLSSFNPVCKGIPAFQLTGGIPAGGTYSGISVNNGYFNPLFASVYTITYTYTDPNGCSNDTSQIIEVLDLPEVTFSFLPDICVDHNPDTLTGGDPPGGIYSGPGVLNGTFDPSLTGPGTFLINYTFSNVACEDSAQQSLTVRPLPVVTFTPMTGVCVNQDTLMLNGGQPAGGMYSGSGVYQDYFLPDSAGTGSFSLLYTYVDQYGCSDTVSETIEVFPLPLQFNVTGGGVSCQNIGNPVNLDSSEAGVVYRLVLDGVVQGFPFNGTGSSFSFGNQYLPGTYYIYALDLTTACENIMLDTAVVKIIPLPEPGLEDSLTLCEEPNIILDAGNFSDSLFYQWQDGSTNRYFTVYEPGIYWVKVGLDNCIATDTIEIWDCCKFDIANVFTPNSDQFNDIFIPKYFCDLLNFRIEIFNRWGKVVYSSKAIDEGWDGTNSNGGSECAEGTYFYVITYKSVTYPNVRKDNKLTGSVTLLR